MQFANLFETSSSSEWLLYISEWDAPGGGLPLSNIRVTTKVPSTYTVKKMLATFPSPAVPSCRESLVSDISAGDGNVANLFLRCMVGSREVI